MLEYLRNMAEKPVAKILIGLLAFSFVGWGVADWIFGNVMGDNALVRVGDAEVTVQQFNMEKSRQIAAMTPTEQREFYTSPQKVQSLTDSILTTLASQRMAENRAQDLGFVVSDARIATEITAFPEFQFNGAFSTYLFDEVLRNSGYSEAQFANVLRGQVMRAMALGAMSVPVAVPEFAVKAAYNSRYALRDINYATVKYSDFKAGKPTDKQLQEFYAANPVIVPESRSVSYVLIAADMDKPDSYDAGYNTAVKVEDAIISGESLKDAASANKVKYVAHKAFSADKRPVDKNLTDAMILKIFDMEQGLESELIETKNGFLMMRVEKINPQKKADFNDVKKSLIDDWERAEQKKKAYVAANELLVDYNKTGKIAGQSTKKSVSRTSGAPVDVLSAAFNSANGSKAIVQGDNVFYVLGVENVVLPKIDDKKMNSLKSELENMSSRNIMDDYNSFLIREYPVDVNEKLYNRFFAQ